MKGLNFLKALEITDSPTEWLEPDSFERFQETRLKMDVDWPWLNQRVVYEINRHGYRAPDFNTVDWANSIVIFGCSHVFGVGVSQDQTLSHYLSQQLGRPVINMGVGGGSNYVSWFNFIAMLDHWPTPHGVVWSWTDLDRYTSFGGMDDVRNVEHLGWWTGQPLHREWSLRNTQMEFWGIYVQKAVQTLCRLRGIWLCEVAYFEEMARHYGCYWGLTLDIARDNSHPGPQTHEDMARLIANVYRNQRGASTNGS